MANEPGELKANFSAVANYHLDDKLHSHLQLAPVEQVINELAGKGRKTMFLSDIESQVGDAWKENPQARIAVEMITGQHASGFQLTIIEAAHKGEVVYIPVIEDQKRNEVLVVSPVTAENAGAHKKVNVVHAEDFDSVRQVNIFFEDGMRQRRKESGAEEPMAPVTEAVICSLIAAGGGPPVDRESGQLPTTIGGALTAAAKSGRAAAYSVATQKFEDGKLAEKLDPVIFRKGTEEAFTLKNNKLALQTGKPQKPARKPAGKTRRKTAEKLG